MKRSVLVLFIICLFLAACSESNIDYKSTTDETVKHTEKRVIEVSDIKQRAINNDNQLPDLEVHYIDAGQADATLLQYTDDDKTYTILYDAGDWNKNDVVSYLFNQSITDIDLIIISHPHADHIGQLAPIMEKFEVGEVWFSGNTSSSETFQKTVDAVMSSNADYYEPRTGDTFDIGQLAIEILHPSALTGELNEDSISIRFTYGDTRLLFTGDAYQNEELEMIARGLDVDADILQLGHHGSRTSSHPEFMAAVNPEVAIYSAGKDNSYGHPHEEVVNRIKSAGISLYGTDESGTIIVTTDGETYEIETEDDQNRFTEDQTNKNKITDDCIDLNNASVEELQTIKNIGLSRAKAIIDNRPYANIDDLLEVEGIGATIINDIKNADNICGF